MSEAEEWALRNLLRKSDALLLDFDGPICSVFAGFPAPAVAEQLRQAMSDDWSHVLPTEITQSDDPFDVFKFAASLGDEEASYVEAAMRAHEVEAVTSATPTPGADVLLRRWHKSGRQTAIVSNNSTAAIETYLHLHDLSELVSAVSARESADFELLKPNPHLLEHACNLLGVPANDAVFVGDSLTDISAGNAINMPVVGYANKPVKVVEFQAANASAIITDMRVLLEACCQ